MDTCKLATLFLANEVDIAQHRALHHQRFQCFRECSLAALLVSTTVFLRYSTAGSRNTQNILSSALFRQRNGDRSVPCWLNALLPMSAKQLRRSPMFEPRWRMTTRSIANAYTACSLLPHVQTASSTLTTVRTPW